MIEINIPGRGVLELEYLVCDVNGTLALDGLLIDGVRQAFDRLRGRLQIHLVTADTLGKQSAIDLALNLQGVRLQPGGEAEQKAEYVRRLGAQRTAAIGQGANDSLMLKEAALGIAVISREGLAGQTLLSADLVVPDILAAFELFERPLRIVASLRK